MAFRDIQRAGRLDALELFTNRNHNRRWSPSLFLSVACFFICLAEDVPVLYNALIQPALTFSIDLLELGSVQLVNFFELLALFMRRCRQQSCFPWMNIGVHDDYKE